MYFLPMFATRPDRREVSPAFHIAFFIFTVSGFLFKKKDGAKSEIQSG